jgi:hypothetical protein
VTLTVYVCRPCFLERERIADAHYDELLS